MRRIVFNTDFVFWLDTSAINTLISYQMLDVLR